MSKPYIELFINNNRVYFEEPPKIAMTYQNEDVENPTAVKNSFSKTVEIDGIPENNRVFDCFFICETCVQPYCFIRKFILYMFQNEIQFY